VRDDDKTIGEVFRLIESLKDDHGKKLDDIEKQVRITNGRTTKLETQVEGLMRAASIPVTPPSLPIMTPEGESLSIKISPKMWALIASAFMGMSMFGPILADWLKKLTQ